MIEGGGVMVRDGNGREIVLKRGGWRHFDATETGAEA
jgi:hypothetical protein